MYRHLIYLWLSSLIGHSWVIILHMEEGLLLWYDVQLCVVKQFYHICIKAWQLYRGVILGFFFFFFLFLIWWCSFSLFLLVHTGLLFTCSCHGASERWKLSHATVSLTALSVYWLWRWSRKVLLKHCLSKSLHGVIPQNTNLNMCLL
jgi:hypothetical protein